jgi:hypothetical protein
MRSLRRTAELLARAIVAGALAYASFDWLLAGVVLRGLSAAAQGVLRLVQRPVVVTGLTSERDHVVLASYLTGIERPLAQWDADNLPIFLVATLALALAAPACGARRSVENALLAVLVAVPALLATTVIQVQVVAANAAQADLGLRLFDARFGALLAAANRAIGVAMLLLPAAVFAVGYVRFRDDTRRAPMAGRRAPAATRASGAGDRTTLRRLAAAAALEGAVLVVLAAIGSAPVDPRPGLARLVEQNPGATGAYLALASYDALAGIGIRPPPGASPAVSRDRGLDARGAPEDGARTQSNTEVSP